jgi:hypothetical protein
VDSFSKLTKCRNGFLQHVNGGSEGWRRRGAGWGGQGGQAEEGQGRGGNCQSRARRWVSYIDSGPALPGIHPCRVNKEFPRTWM